MGDGLSRRQGAEAFGEKPVVEGLKTWTGKSRYRKACPLRALNSRPTGEKKERMLHMPRTTLFVESQGALLLDISSARVRTPGAEVR